MPGPNVFTPDFVADMQRRYDRFPEYQKPLISKIATAKYRSDDRERIESWLVRLDSDDIRAFVSLLRNADQFLHAYGELAVAQVLLDAGWSVAYERPYNANGQRLTPDWTLRRGTLHVICDVFTAGLVESRGHSESATREVIGRLSTIEAPYLVNLDVPNGFTLAPTDQKQLCGEFARWVRADVGIGSIWRRNDCTIKIVGPSRGRIVVIATDNVHIVPTAVSITTNLREKARKYGVLGLPLLVAATKHPDAEADELMFADCVLGDLVYRSIQLANGSIVGATVREPGGAFDGRAELSAAFWINPYAIGRLDHQLIPNPAAVRPLPEELIASLTSVED
jgi:hypothetical protein